jgi:hypothetical protein
MSRRATRTISATIKGAMASLSGPTQRMPFESNGNYVRSNAASHRTGALTNRNEAITA